MKFAVIFTLNKIRRSGIVSGYRPDWTSDSKPDPNCAVLSFTGQTLLNPGDTCPGILEPLRSELWEQVKVSDTLICLEGSKKVGEAVVIGIS